MKQSECYKVPTSIPEEHSFQQSSHEEDDEENDPIVVAPSPTPNDIPPNRDLESNKSSRPEAEIISDAEADLLPPIEQVEEEIPQSIIPTSLSASEENTADTRPQRLRQPPNRLCMSWTGKSYT